MTKPITTEILDAPTALISDWLAEVESELAILPARIAAKDQRANILKGIAEQIEAARERIPK